MNLLSEVPVYWLNFALHTLLVSLLAWIACRLVRDAGRRAFLSVVGVLGIVILPWLTALRPLETLQDPIAQPLEVSGNALPGWTIRIENPLPAPSPVAVIAPPPVARIRTIDWLEVLRGTWIAGAVTGLALGSFRQWKLVRWARTHRHPTDDEWRSIAGGIVRRTRVRICEHVTTPCVIGFFRPRVIVPRFLFGEGMKAELSWALRHEAEHLHAGDSRMAVLLSFTKALVWWNPFIHLLCATWSESRERVCDSRATEGGANVRDYGNFLLDLSGRMPAVPKGAVPMAGSTAARRMKRRLQAILRGDRVKGRSAVFQITSVFLIAGVALAISFAGIRRADAAPPAPPPSGAPHPVADVSASAPQAVSQPPSPEAQQGGQEADSGEGERKTVPRQVKISTLFLDTPEEVPEAGSILDYAQRQLVVTRYDGVKGVKWMTPPSVTMQNRKRSSVEIIRDDGKTPGQPGPHEARRGNFVGLSMQAEPEIMDDHIRISMDCLFHFTGETTFSGMGNTMGGWPSPPENFNWKKVRPVQAKAIKELKSGQTLVLAFEGEDEGRHLTGFFTATQLDATGRPLDDAGNPPPDTKQEWHGNAARMSAAIIELPPDGKLGPYWLNQGVLYPSRHLPGILAEARQRGPDRVIGLGTSVLSEDSPPEPWAAYRAEVRMQLTGKKVFRLRLGLSEGGEIETWGSVGYVIGTRLPPESGGRRRLLLLSFEEPQ